MSQTDRNGLTNDPTAPPTVLVWRGTWVIGAEYAPYNLSINSGTTYLCVTGHTAGASFSTDLALGYWEVFAARGATGAGTGDLLAANNLSEVDPATARANIGAAESGSNGSITHLTGIESITAAETPVAGADFIYFMDTSDGAKLKKATASSLVGVFASGTRTSFNQTAAPIGWTKDTTVALNDSILRIVTGAVGSGGSTAFSTFNGQTATAAHTLTTADIPQINLEGYGNTAGTPTASGYPTGVAGYSPVSKASSPAWVTIPRTPFAQAVRIQDLGGGAHSHGLTTSIKYNDFIIAQKD